MDAIAERRLELRTSGETIEVRVRLGRPEPDNSQEAWTCEYQIQCGDTSRSMVMHGADSMQALQLSMATLDGELKHLTRKRGGTLWHWDEPVHSILENGGLLPKTIGDSLT